MKKLSNYALIASVIVFVLALISIAVGGFGWTVGSSEGHIFDFQVHGNPYICYVPSLFFEILFLGLFVGLFALKEGRLIAIVGGLGALVGIANVSYEILRCVSVDKLHHMYMAGEQISYSQINDLAASSRALPFISMLLQLIVMAMILIKYRKEMCVSVPVSIGLVLYILYFADLMSDFPYVYADQLMGQIATVLYYAIFAVLMLSLSLLFKKKATICTSSANVKYN